MSFRNLLTVGQRPTALWLKRQLHDSKLPQVLPTSTKSRELIGIDSPKKADYQRDSTCVPRKYSSTEAKVFWDSIIFHKSEEPKSCNEEDLFNDRED